MAKRKKNKILKVNKDVLVNENNKNYGFFLNFYKKITKYLEDDLYFDFNSHVLIAVSGGVDSMSLLDVFANLTQLHPELRLTVAHFNHNLRGKASDEDEKFVKRLTKIYNIRYFSSSGDVNSYAEIKGVSIEQAARTLRYKYFEKISKMTDADFLLTAHTLDDSIETFFINLFRGTGLTGLKGIPERRLLVKRIMIIRPFLKIRKKELIDYAKKRKLNWTEDDSNKLLNFTRNKVRLKLLPEIEEQFNPQIIETIQRTQKLISGAENVISNQVLKAMPTLVCNKSTGRFGLKISGFKIFDDFMKGEIIHRAILNNFNLKNISMQTIDRIIDLEEKSVGSICEINKRYFVLKDRDCLMFIRKDAEKSNTEIIQKQGEFYYGNYKIILKKVRKNQVKYYDNKNIEYVDMDLIPSVLYIRTWNEGDKFYPIGMNGCMKLSDFFINNKVLLSDKKSKILLCSKSDIIWVCGMRLSDKFKITDSTTNFLRLEIKYIKNGE